MYNWYMLTSMLPWSTSVITIWLDQWQKKAVGGRDVAVGGAHGDGRVHSGGGGGDGGVDGIGGVNDGIGGVNDGIGGLHGGADSVVVEVMMVALFAPPHVRLESYIIWVGKKKYKK